MNYLLIRDIDLQRFDECKLFIFVLNFYKKVINPTKNGKIR